MNVLVVDDDAMVRSWVRMALEASEFRVVAEAESGSEVEALLAVWPVDLLLVDYRLPDGTGTELVRALRLRGIDTPAVLMTANPESGFNESVRDAAAQGTVLAPAKSIEEMQRVAFNNYLDAAVCAFFVVLVVAMCIYALKICLQALRQASPTAHEIPALGGREGLPA